MLTANFLTGTRLAESEEATRGTSARINIKMALKAGEKTNRITL